MTNQKTRNRFIAAILAVIAFFVLLFGTGSGTVEMSKIHYRQIGQYSSGDSSVMIFVGGQGQAMEKSDFQTFYGSPGGGGSASMGTGTSFPGTPATGDQFFRTDLNETFIFNGSRWLGQMQTVYFGRNSNNTDNSYPRNPGNSVSSNTFAYTFPYDVLVTNFHFDWVSPDPASGNYELTTSSGTARLSTINSVNDTLLNSINTAGFVLRFRRDGETLTDVFGWAHVYRAEL